MTIVFSVHPNPKRQFRLYACVDPQPQLSMPYSRNTIVIFHISVAKLGIRIWSAFRHNHQHYDHHHNKNIFISRLQDQPQTKINKSPLILKLPNKS